jgi:hypothetical protein
VARQPLGQAPQVQVRKQKRIWKCWLGEFMTAYEIDCGENCSMIVNVLDSLWIECADG